MKTIKIIVTAITAIVVLSAIAIAVFISQFDLNAYLDPIKKQASAILHRDVSIDKAKLEIHIFKGLNLSVEGIGISDDPAISREPLIKLKHLSAGVNVLSFLLKKEILITHVVVDGFDANIIKDKQGIMNMQRLVMETANSPKSTGSSHVAETKPSPAMVIPQLTIKEIFLNNGRVHYVDLDSRNPIDVEIPQINLVARQFSLDKPFDINVQMALLSNKPNVDFSSQVKLSLGDTSCELKQMRLVLDLAGLDMDIVAKSFKQMSKEVLPTKLDIQWVWQADTVRLTAQGINDLQVTSTIKNGMVALPQLASTITDLNVLMTGDKQRLEIKNFNMSLGSGQISILGNVKDYLATPSYELSFEAKALRSNQLIPEQQMPVVINAAINADGKLSGVSFDLTEALVSLNGELHVSISRGKIEKVNMANAMLNPLARIPILGPALKGILESGMDNLLNSDYSKLNGAGANMVLANGEAKLSDILVDTDQVVINGEGKILLPAMDTDVNLNTVFNEEISQKLFKSIKNLQGLSNGQGNLVVPGFIRGQLPKIQYQVDASDIAKRVGMTTISQEAGKILDKNPEIKNIFNSIVGGSKSQSQEPSSEPAEGTEDKGSGEDLINNLFKKISK